MNEWLCGVWWWCNSCDVIWCDVVIVVIVACFGGDDNNNCAVSEVVIFLLWVGAFAFSLWSGCFSLHFFLFMVNILDFIVAAADAVNTVVVGK